MNSEKVKVIAEKVLKKANMSNDEKFGSVIAILMVISIILTVIRVLQECNKTKLDTFSGKDKYEYFGKQIKENAIRRSWFTKMTIKKAIRRELTNEERKEYGHNLLNAILDTGETLKDDELITLAEAANV